jgi:GT2 family glycosyltransferase
LDKRITVVVTSCDRHDLLRQTLESLINTIDLPIFETIVIEDGSTPKPEWLGHGRFRELGNIRWLSNETRMGQIYSIGWAYSEVKTEYVFHCEDDWNFIEQGFLKLSMDILDAHPEVITVSLRGDTG